MKPSLLFPSWNIFGRDTSELVFVYNSLSCRERAYSIQDTTAMEVDNAEEKVEESKNTEEKKEESKGDNEEESLYDRIKKSKYEMEEDESLTNSRFTENLEKHCRQILRSIVTANQLAAVIKASNQKDDFFNSIEWPESDFGDWWTSIEDKDLLLGAYL